MNSLVKKLEKQIESDKPKLAKLDQVLANCNYSDPNDAKKASEQHQERSKIATTLEQAENDLLDAIIEIESLEESLGVQTREA